MDSIDWMSCYLSQLVCSNVVKESPLDVLDRVFPFRAQGRTDELEQVVSELSAFRPLIGVCPEERLEEADDALDANEVRRHDVGPDQ